MPGFPIPPVRLAIAVICVALALVLAAAALISRALWRARFGRRGRTQPGVYQARYHGRPARRKGGAPAAGPRHSRPSSHRRRYGKGYRPEPARPRRRKVSRRKYGTFRHYGHSGGPEGGGGAG